MEYGLTFLSENLITDILVIYAMNFDLCFHLMVYQGCISLDMRDFAGCYTIDGRYQAIQLIVVSRFITFRLLL